MMSCKPLPNKAIRCTSSVSSAQDMLLDVSQPHIMGILNVTPDSFSDGGKFNEVDAALRQCEQMIQAGASIIDVGGESTRPDATAVSSAEELDRVVPIVEAIARRFDSIISVDTSTPAVMQAAYEMGGHIWNDVRALRREGAAELAAQLDVPVMLMHSRGEPDTMMQLTDYDDVVQDVKTELTATVTRALATGVRRDNIILDVGFGFAKTTAQNLTLLKSLSDFADLELPMMIGLSRKRMLADALVQAGLDSDVSQRDIIGTTAAVMALQQGVSIVRTHNVLATAQAFALFRALQS